MSENQATYGRARTAALVGLGVQFLLAVVVGLAGLWSQGPALHTATWHLLGGLPIWAVLVAISYQHQLERAEALEAEQLAKRDRQTAEIFDTAGEQLQLARQRLASFYRWGLHGVSLFVSLYLLVTGGLLFRGAWGRMEEGTLDSAALGEAASPLVLMFLMAFVAFVAFIVARYTAGMTRKPAWQLLRGGASYLMGTAVVAVLIMGGAVFAEFGNRAVMGWMSLLIPGLMLFIGVEVALLFVLGIYRPRRAGEIARPAFDSRVLGLLTSPESLAKAIGDTLNYQFGFEVSSSWFYRLVSRWVTPLFAGGLLILWLFTSVVIVEPHQQAIITLNGRMVSASAERLAHPPGIHFKAPWPFGRVSKYPVGRLQEIRIGAELREDEELAVLWTNQHDVEGAGYLLTAPTPPEAHFGPGRAEELASVIGGSEHMAATLVAAQVSVQYEIEDLARYAQAFEDPDQVLRNLAEREVTRYFVTRHIDALLGVGRIEAGRVLTGRIQQAARARGLGLRVVFVGLPGIHPPAGTGGEEAVAGPAEAFLEPVGAISERRARVEEARQAAIEMLAETAGSRAMARRIAEKLGELRAHREALEAAREAGEPTEALEKRYRETEVAVEGLLAEAGGRAATSIYQARAYRWQRAHGEWAKAHRFASQAAAYRASPRFYSARRYLEVLAEGLGEARKTIVATEQAEVPTYRLDLKDSADALGSIMQTE